MINRLLQDLRFIIGAFFLILSVILIVHGLLNPPTDAAVNLNLNVGGYMFLFSTIMIALGLWSDAKEQSGKAKPATRRGK